MEPFYDPLRSYEENYDQGPFGLFAQSPQPVTQGKSSFIGFDVDIPFGIPAGPLLNGRFVKAAWGWGFSLATYKTVRRDAYPTHPYPNVIRVKSDSSDITPGQTVIGDSEMSDIRIEKDGITNSFGVPSKPGDEWRRDVSETLKVMRKGHDILILSFMGTKKEDMGERDYIEDFAATCRMAVGTNAPVIEVNFSCPNFGKEGLICNDVAMSATILEALHTAKGNKPLLVKIGYFPKESQVNLEKLIHAIAEYADGVVAINTISAKVVDKDGRQFLPGSPVRLSSGICGAAIRWGGLEMAERILAIKRKNNLKALTVVGVGGITTVADYFRYRNLGVDAAQSATGAMWQPDLALRIRKEIKATP